MAVVDDPTQNELVKQVVAGAKRTLVHKTTKKEPMTPEILERLVDEFTQEDADLNDIRTVTICLIGFTGFLRYSELEELKESDL